MRLCQKGLSIGKPNFVPFLATFPMISLNLLGFRLDFRWLSGYDVDREENENDTYSVQQRYLEAKQRAPALLRQQWRVERVHQGSRQTKTLDHFVRKVLVRRYFGC